MTKPTSVEDLVSYGLGRKLGQQLAESRYQNLNFDLLFDGIKSAYERQDSIVSQTEINTAFSEAYANMHQEDQQFLEQNKDRDGVVTTDSGLQYQVIKDGIGERPKAESVVRTHYHGTLTSGEVFDSSYDRGEPAEFAVSEVIAGWTEALQLMTVGSKWRLFVPSELAYGEHGAGRKISPNATLIFEIELLAIID